MALRRAIFGLEESIRSPGSQTVSLPSCSRWQTERPHHKLKRSSPEKRESVRSRTPGDVISGLLCPYRRWFAGGEIRYTFPLCTTTTLFPNAE